MRMACWMLKAKNTHSQYVILIAFPLQKWSIEPASMLRYTCTACLVYYYEFPEYVSCGLYVESAASLTQVFEELLIYLLVACSFLSSVVLYCHLCTKGYMLSLDYFAITFISLPVAQTFQEFLFCCVYMSE
jgi:hypothetical protein